MLVVQKGCDCMTLKELGYVAISVCTTGVFATFILIGFEIIVGL